LLVHSGAAHTRFAPCTQISTHGAFDWKPAHLLPRFAISLQLTTISLTDGLNMLYDACRSLVKAHPPSFVDIGAVCRTFQRT